MLSFFTVAILAASPGHAQLFDDIEKKDNVSNKDWVIGGDLGVLLTYYSIDNNYPLNRGFLGSSSYFTPGFHVGGVFLRSFDGLKVGASVGFQRFSGSDDPNFISSSGASPQEPPNLEPFADVSMNLLNLSARGEFAFMSSVDGGLFGIFELGVSILSGDYPGDSVSPLLRGGFGLAYEIRLTDTTNLQLGYLISYSQFRNEWEDVELRHSFFSNTITAGLRF